MTSARTLLWDPGGLRRYTRTTNFQLGRQVLQQLSLGLYRLFQGFLPLVRQSHTRIGRVQGAFNQGFNGINIHAKAASAVSINDWGLR